MTVAEELLALASDSAEQGAPLLLLPAGGEPQEGFEPDCLNQTDVLHLLGWAAGLPGSPRILSDPRAGVLAEIVGLLQEQPGKETLPVQIRQEAKNLLAVWRRAKSLEQLVPSRTARLAGLISSGEDWEVLADGLASLAMARKDLANVELAREIYSCATTRAVLASLTRARRQEVGKEPSTNRTHAEDLREASDAWSLCLYHTSRLLRALDLPQALFRLAEVESVMDDILEQADMALPQD